jgi:hypothetical protein
LIARAQVHWVSFETKFTPFDAICELTEPDQLTENSLIVNKDLHSARLAKPSEPKASLGVVEEATEEVLPRKTTQTSEQLPPPIFLPELPILASEQSFLMSPSISDDTSRPKSALSDVPSQARSMLSDTPSQVKSPSMHSDRAMSPQFEKPEKPAEEKQDLLTVPAMQRADSAHSETSRPSTRSGRQSIDNLFGPSLDFSSLEKPKPKLGPRPAMDRRNLTSRTSTDSRPTAALPSGMRVTRSPTSPLPPTRPFPPMSSMRPKSSRENLNLGRPLPPPPPIPETDIYSIQRPKSSAGSVRSLPGTLPKSQGNSKERQRLMKFREMYKQKESNKAKQAVTQTIPEDKQIILEELKEEVPESKNSQAPIKELDPIDTTIKLDLEQLPLEQIVIPESLPSTQNDDKSTFQSTQSTQPTRIDTSYTSSIPTSQPSPTSIGDSLDPISTRPTSVSEVSEQVVSGSKSLLTVDDTTDFSHTAFLESDQNVKAIETPTETSSATPTHPPSIITTGLSGEEKPPPVEESPERTRNLSISTMSSISTPLGLLTHSSNAKRTSLSSFDDDLIDELSIAEVQEATPISVKSPISSFWAKKASQSNQRASSAPSHESKTAQNGAFLVINKARRQDSPIEAPTEDLPMAKKRVEGGIAAKIADLQRNFSKGSSATPAIRSVSNKSYAERTSSLHPPPPPGSEPVATPQRRLSKLFSRKSPNPDVDSSFPVDPSSPTHYNSQITTSIINRSPNLNGVQRSVSVSVRTPIVRSEPRSIPIMIPDSATPSPSQGLGVAFPAFSTSTPLPNTTSLHQRAHSSTTTRRRTFHPRSASVSSLRSTPGSPTPSEARGEFIGLRLSTDASGWRSFGRRKSVTKSPRPASGSFNFMASNSSLDTTISVDDKGDGASFKKNGSRASRLLKRMSSSISSMTGSRGLQTLNERTSVGQEIRRSEREKPLGLGVGDLNVQFPDTLVRSPP